MKNDGQYVAQNLRHPNGGVISRSFWWSSPLSQREAKKWQLYCDVLQELHLVALELKHETAIRKISNYTQRRAYNFWKEYGFRKIRQGKRVIWQRRESSDPSILS